MLIWNSSSSPACKACWTALAPCRATCFSPASARACDCKTSTGQSGAVPSGKTHPCSLSIISKLLRPMITAPFSPSASPTTSWNCSMALPIQAKTSETSSFLSAINPSSETERPNITFPMMFSNLCECSSLLFGLQLLHILDQVLPGHAHPLQDTDIESDFQSRCARELDTSRHARFPCLFHKDHGGQVLGHPFDGIGMFIGEGRGVDQLLRGDDLAVYGSSPLIVPLRRTQAVVPDATRPQVDGTNGNGVRRWRPPAHQMLCSGEHLKPQRAGCAEVPLHDNFLFPNTRDQRVVIKHWCPHVGCWYVARWPALPGGSRPDDRSVLPRGDEKSAARTPTPGTVRASADKSSDWPAAGPPQWQPRSEP